MIGFTIRKSVYGFSTYKLVFGPTITAHEVQCGGDTIPIFEFACFSTVAEWVKYLNLVVEALNKKPSGFADISYSLTFYLNEEEFQKAIKI